MPSDHDILTEMHANVLHIKENMAAVLGVQEKHECRIKSLESTRSFGKGAMWVILGIGGLATTLLAFIKKVAG